MEVLDKIKTPAQLQEDFSSLFKKTFHAEPTWLKTKREKAFSDFSKSGFPDRKNEEYKYTDVKKLFAKKHTAVHNEAHKFDFRIVEKFIEKNSIKLFFVNGWLHKDSTLSVKLQKGVIVGNLATELFIHPEIIERHLRSISLSLGEGWGEALNTALWTDGAFVYVPKNVALETTIEIVNVFVGNDNLLISPRNIIIAEENAQVNIVEQNISLQSNSESIINAVTEIVVGENAKVQCHKIQNDNKNLFQLHNTFVTQHKQSVFDTCTYTSNSNWVRNNLSIFLNGEYCETHLNGLFLAKGNEHVDNHTQVYHNQPNCQSNQLYKGILNDKSVGVFNGKIYVAKDAQKTNAYQSSKNILLSDDATINTKPQLEIYADDVKCSHGSSTGQIDEDALFYLRSRGLSVDSAKILLMNAFAGDVIDKIKLESLKVFINDLVEKSLNDPI